jgi:hypothetical protein
VTQHIHGGTVLNVHELPGGFITSSDSPHTVISIVSVDFSRMVYHRMWEILYPTQFIIHQMTRCLTNLFLLVINVFFYEAPDSVPGDLKERRDGEGFWKWMISC